MLSTFHFQTFQASQVGCLKIHALEKLDHPTEAAALNYKMYLCIHVSLEGLLVRFCQLDFSALKCVYSCLLCCREKNTTVCLEY